MSDTNRSPDGPTYQVLVCDGPSCGVMHESERLEEHLQRVLDESDDLAGRVVICRYTCFGRCDDGPNVFVHRLAPGEDPHGEPDPDVFDVERGFYPGMDEDKIVRAVCTHVRTGEPVEDLVDDY